MSKQENFWEYTYKQEKENKKNCKDDLSFLDSLDKDIEKMKQEKSLVKKILSNQSTNNEWYTPKEPIINLLNKLNLPKDKIIWCPFDTQESNFVKVLQENNYQVIYSHINNGQDFYNYEPEKYDIIISNPPFENKRKLIERCLSLGKDFILLYGATICSQSMGDTLNKCGIWFIQRNIKFFNNNNEIKSFQCCWVMSNNIYYILKKGENNG